MCIEMNSKELKRTVFWQTFGKHSSGFEIAGDVYAGFQYDLHRSLLVAEWAYEQGEKSGAHVWFLDREYAPLTPEWRRVLQSS